MSDIFSMEETCIDIIKVSIRDYGEGIQKSKLQRILRNIDIDNDIDTPKNNSTHR